ASIPAAARIEAAQPLDIYREAKGELSLVIDYRVETPPTAPVTLGMEGAEFPVTGALTGAPAGQWRTLAVPLRCFARAGVDMQRVSVPFRIATAGRFALSISDVRIASAAVAQDRCGEP
nr:1,4-beta-D-glucan glucohydrolase [Pseudomonadota bacterium]